MIALIDGCGSNLTSVQFALKRIGITSTVTHDKKQIEKAEVVIFPGVGHAQRAMKALHQMDLIDTLKKLTQPVLGICLGMQLFYDFSEEGNVPCLGIIPGVITRLPHGALQPIPHMGWNTLQFDENHWKQKNANPNYCYFVHSYAAPVNAYTVATTHYTKTFTAMVRYKNFVGMQFHPEKSGLVGEQLLQQFLTMRCL